MTRQQQMRPTLARRVATCLIPAIMCGFALAGACLSSRVKAQPAISEEVTGTRDIWDGVFTAAQAKRGETVFRTNCARCHDGAGEAPDLSADSFLVSWEGHSLDRLYTKIRETMPPGGDVNSVDAARKLDALTYILRLHDFPPGEEELKADSDTLMAIQIERKDGGALRTGAMVLVVGCLTEVIPDAWLLTKSTEPAAATLDPQMSEQPKAVEMHPLGTQTVRLLNVFPRPEAYKGHRIEAKGFLIREENALAINVVMLRSLAASCQ